MLIWHSFGDRHTSLDPDVPGTLVVLFMTESVGSSILTLRICGGSSADTEPVEVKSVCDHILLGLEQDNVHLGGKQTAQDHETTQANGNAHCCRLHLQKRLTMSVPL